MTPRTSPSAQSGTTTETESTIVDDVAAASPTLPIPTTGMVVGECIDARHPTLLGRVLCRIVATDGTTTERWVPTLMSLPVREGDRVLLVRPHNHAEPIVVGVLDGFSPRPEAARTPGATRALKADETIRFETERGEPLVEIAPGGSGPVVRLLSVDLEVETPGAVRLRAGSIELHAREGQVRVEASDDVVVQGEAIHLN